MTPHPARVASRAALAVLPVTMALLAACPAPHGGSPANAAAPSASGAVSVAPAARLLPGVDPEPTRSAPKPPSQPPDPTNTSPPVKDYVSRLPRFPAGPTPIRVTLPHDKDRAAFVSTIPTTQKVAFLTIDDGWVKHPEALRLLQASKVPVTLFLGIEAISDDVDFFRQLENLGAVVEDHTISHPNLALLGYDEQHRQLCESTGQLMKWYDRRPLYFRPPYGEANDDTLRAAWDCGLKAGFFWTQTINEGKVRYQTAEHVIHPGDIILMHFRPAFPEDFLAALRAIKRAGLTPALLEDYVQVV